jgi:mono/diheme cytochrome c family protein
MNLHAAEKTAAERGREALTGKAFVSPVVTKAQYERLWRVWGLKEKPDDFAKQFRERYGLHESPYPNKDLPMGLREAPGLFGVGLANDCLLCHAGSIAGKSVIGLGNASLDLQGLFDDFARTQGFKQVVPITFSNVRGTTEASASAAYLFQIRHSDLTLRTEPAEMKYTTTACEDVPAWWLMKRKKTMYATGSHSARSVRSLMAFLLDPFNGADYIKKQEATFRDIQAYLLTLEPPKYPFAIDAKKTQAGKTLFEKSCARCHGTYGEGASYPNKVIDLDDIGTDATLATGFPIEAEDLYNRSWFGQEIGPEGKKIPAKANRGYQAPPLDGIWATAPYFHNGSSPTIYHVLNSKARPKIFTRSYRTREEDYDAANVGWKITTLKAGPDPGVVPMERRKIYDTTQPGRANTGHTFGDKLSDAERMAIIEYLKTL